MDLVITDTQKIQGSFFNPTYVREVIDLSCPNEPFFVEELKIERLTSEVEDANFDSNELRL